MRAGRLDRMVQVLRAAVVDDEMQARFGALAPLGAPIPAEKADISDGERFRSGGVDAALSTRFTVRFNALSASILTSDRLECEGRIYEIVGIKDVGGRRRALEISARRAH
ncbi:head-tail adaptor protein [Pikeienuella sp. HZG-20]|uniref:head-tail adaptor protein n=1 Tax=Paludibacillus litoralis TaxID=3133267 RepID=UPI0030EC2356